MPGDFRYNLPLKMQMDLYFEIKEFKIFRVSFKDFHLVTATLANFPTEPRHLRSILRFI